MKLRMLVLILAALLSQGCASFFGHYDYMLATRKTEPTAYYPGTVIDLGLIGAGLMAPFVAPFKKDAEGWMIVAVPFVLVDLPCSFTLDTLFVPGDYFYHLEQNDTYWADAFRTGVIQQKVARRHLSELDQNRIGSLLGADKSGAASNVVDVIFGLAVSNDIQNVEIALSAKRGLFSAQYWTLYSRPHNMGKYDRTPYIHGCLAMNPSIPMDLLITLASSADFEVRIAALESERLPLEVATNVLAWLAHTTVYDAQKYAATHRATPPELLTQIAVENMALLGMTCAARRGYVKAHRHDGKSYDDSDWQYDHGGVLIAMASNPNCPASTLEQLAHSDFVWVRIGVAKSPLTPQALLAELAVDTNAVHRVLPDEMLERDNNRMRQQGMLQAAVAANANCPAPVLQQLARSMHAGVRAAVAKNPSTPQSALTLLTTDKEYNVRMALSERPKSPAGDKAPR